MLQGTTLQIDTLRQNLTRESVFMAAIVENKIDQVKAQLQQNPALINQNTHLNLDNVSLTAHIVAALLGHSEIFKFLCDQSFSEEIGLLNRNFIIPLTIHYGNDAKIFDSFFERFDSVQREQVLNEVKFEKVNMSILMFVAQLGRLDMFQVLWNYYSPTGQKAQLDYYDTKGCNLFIYALRSTPEMLVQVWNVYPKTEHPRLLDLKTSDSKLNMIMLSILARDCHMLPAVLKLYPQEARHEQLNYCDETGKNLLMITALTQVPAKLAIVWNLLTNEQKLRQLNHKDKQQQDFLTAISSHTMAPLMKAALTSLYATLKLPLPLLNNPSALAMMPITPSPSALMNQNRRGSSFKPPVTRDEFEVMKAELVTLKRRIEQLEGVPTFTMAEPIIPPPMTYDWQLTRATELPITNPLPLPENNASHDSNKKARFAVPLSPVRKNR